jgi:hypothetical protein
MITSRGSIKKLEFEDLVPESGAGERVPILGSTVVTFSVTTLGGLMLGPLADTLPTSDI